MKGIVSKISHFIEVSCAMIPADPDREKIFFGGGCVVCGEGSVGVGSMLPYGKNKRVTKRWF